MPVLLLPVMRHRPCNTAATLFCRIENPDQAAAEGATMVVDESKGTVTVQAGVPQRDLLDYLANYL